MDMMQHDTDSELESYDEYDSESENKEPYYFLHPITDTQAESILQFERSGSWMLRTNPYVITIRIEDGYIHHKGFSIQTQRAPEVIEESVHIYPTFTVYLDKLSKIYGLITTRQIILQNKKWDLIF